VLARRIESPREIPIADSIEVLGDLRRQVEETSGASLRILGVGTTGYAKDILQQVLSADVALVETVAHTQSALRYFADPQVIVDVGGQDIKLILLREGRVRDFRINAQCSAGNGYFLQSTAEGLGIPVERYAETAFAAQFMPTFGYGCAVFLQSDIVNFQRQGWRAEEILAGLATVLPRNVFLHVAKAPNLTAMGSRFILQGGTQNNLAAVKAQVDFLCAGFRGTGIEPEIHVHPHCGEAGAIGAGLEAMRLWREGHVTDFIGMEAVSRIRYTTTCNEETRCRFCKNACLRTFLDVQIAAAEDCSGDDSCAPTAREAESRRIILAGCEKGAVDDLKSMREHSSATGCDQGGASQPGGDCRPREVWRSRHPESVADPLPAHAWSAAARRRIAHQQRGKLRIGIPRVLSMYAYAPLFSAYLESLGVRAENIVYSDVTTGEMYRAGSSRGSIDPCFPSKIAIAHFHNLLFKQHERQPLDVIFFPMFDVLASPLVNTKANNGCPTASITPETVEAAFTKETDLIAERGIQYIHPLVNLSHRKLFARQMWQAWEPVLGLSVEENDRAVAIGFANRSVLNPNCAARRANPRPTGGRRPIGNRDAGPSLSSRPRHQPWDHGAVPKAGLSHLFAEHPAHGRRPAGTALRRGNPRRCDQSCAGNIRCVEDRLFGQLQSQILGRQVHGSPSQSGCGRVLQLSSAATMHLSTASSSKSSSVPERPSFPSKTWMKTVLPIPFGCAWRPSTTF
jgi:hypothetical protein